MKIKLYPIILLGILCFSGCVVYNVHVNKNICIHGNENTPSITGSEIDDISSSPDVKPDVDVNVPLK